MERVKVRSQRVFSLRDEAKPPLVEHRTVDPKWYLEIKERVGCVKEQEMGQSGPYDCSYLAIWHSTLLTVSGSD